MTRAGKNNAARMEIPPSVASHCNRKTKPEHRKRKGENKHREVDRRPKASAEQQGCQERLAKLCTGVGQSRQHEGMKQKVVEPRKDANKQF